MPVSSVVRFYDDLAASYHLIFADWERSMRAQGELLGRLITSQLGPSPLSVLDCACGIGTQAIGLALQGFRVHATDISGESVRRAVENAERYGVLLPTAIADMRNLDTVAGTFDVVLACDNAVPHLLTDKDLALAARSMYERLRDGGLMIVSMRDYDALLRDRPRATMPQIHDGPDGRRIYVQIWDWDDTSPIYTIQLYLIQDGDDEPKTERHATRYRALQREEWTEILRAEGFTEVTWRMPAESGYYQPLVTARRS